jgi:hypothetical protein
VEHVTTSHSSQLAHHGLKADRTFRERHQKARGQSFVREEKKGNAIGQYADMRQAAVVVGTTVGEGLGDEILCDWWHCATIV